VLSTIKNWARRVPGLRAATVDLLRLWSVITTRELFPPGHFHSPTPDQKWIRNNRPRLFSQQIDAIPGVDLRDREQLQLFEELVDLFGEFETVDMQADGWRYVPDAPSNDFFALNCAFLLYAMLRRFRPRRIHEVGSGFSSALMLDVDQCFLDRQTQFTFIEPYPARLESLLRGEDAKRCRILKMPVQDVELQEFTALEENDFLFVDSSHVSKIGSDVNVLLFDVLPLLNPGVLVHFHDIHWPFEYSESFLMEGRYWNESYMLRAFLQYNNAFEVIMFDDYLAQRHATTFQRSLPAFPGGLGGSLWLRRV